MGSQRENLRLPAEALGALPVSELEEDQRSSPLRLRPLPLRLRNFRPSAEGYLVSVGGPLPYMVRLREIEAMSAAHERNLEDERERLASEVNDLIDRYNRWFPVESRLPMDPRRRDYALVNGRDYRLRPLDARWALERFADAA